MDLGVLNNKIDDLMEHYETEKLKILNSIIEGLNSGKYHYMEIEEGEEGEKIKEEEDNVWQGVILPPTRFLTDAPANIVQECIDESDDWEFAVTVIDKGFCGIIWGNTLEELFGKEIFEKYLYIIHARDITEEEEEE